MKVEILASLINLVNGIDDSNANEKDINIISNYIGKYCIINRQPTLHRLGVLAFKIQPHLGKTIQIPPMSTSPYNADFDGDAVAIYIPISDKSRKDVIEKISIKANLLSPTDLTLVPSASQDICLGIYEITK